MTRRLTPRSGPITRRLTPRVDTSSGTRRRRPNASGSEVSGSEVSGTSTRHLNSAHPRGRRNEVSGTSTRAPRLGTSTRPHGCGGGPGTRHHDLCPGVHSPATATVLSHRPHCRPRSVQGTDPLALARSPTRAPRERSAHLAAVKGDGRRSHHRPFASECSPFVAASSFRCPSAPRLRVRAGRPGVCSRA